ncbi:hypothetical protein J8Y17_01620 [Bacillus cereus]|uniref:hypothetical protein n=1 Tax=Bacillus cereus TaxID=1396 RepID=UPI001B8C27A0|nr:hypothetical protein [Bacillus cereus]MDA1758587.1 hypothetical protein [Bacillus cereus]QUW32021.1 hypothetical protein J8Y17_01620 [Bacillus cereus]
MELMDNFKNYIQENFFYIIENQSEMNLVEHKGKQYQVTIKVDKEENKFLVIHNLEDLKKDHASYLKQHPKDCDYIILDLIEKIVYVIELKDTDITNSNFMKQLRAGEYWLEHLLFCCQLEGYTEHWQVKRVGIRYDSTRPSKVRRPRKADQSDNLPSPFKYMRDVSGYDLFVFRGNVFHLSSLIPV